MSFTTAVAVASALVVLSGACAREGSDTASSKEPWGTNTVAPADLARELEGPDKPVVVCTNLPSMYRMGHIPGAVLHGPASSPAVIGELTAWANALPRSTSLVIYCGCCPMEYCPNLRPAYQALHGMGFERVRVLVLPENFGRDWAARGYPVAR